MTTVTSYAAEQEAIMARLSERWAAITPIAWPNKGYKPVEGTAYIEARVARQDAFNADINAGASRIRYPGILTVDVRTPLNVGELQALEWGDTVAETFRNASFDGLHFRATTVRDFGVEGAWYRVQVTCPFYRDSIH